MRKKQKDMTSIDYTGKMHINLKIYDLKLISKENFLVYCHFANTTGYLPNVSPKDRREGFETFIERMNSFLKHLKRIRTLLKVCDPLVKGKKPGRFITTYDSITSNPIVADNLQINDKQVKWLKET